MIPLLESQLVVDHIERDEHGFLVESFCSNSVALEDISAEIRSLEVRATSRESDALASADGFEQYMLGLESRELRKRARNLRYQRLDIISCEWQHRTDTTNSVQFEAGFGR